MSKPIYTNIDKEFKSRVGFDTIITRNMYISDFSPRWCAEELSDEQMQDIADKVGKSMSDKYTAEQLDLYRIDRDGTNEETSRFTEEQESLVEEIEEYETRLIADYAIESGMRDWTQLTQARKMEIIRAFND